MTVAPLDPARRGELRPTVRVGPAPPHTPPYDDELDVTDRARPQRRLTVLPGQGELPLEWLLPNGLPSRPRMPLVLVRSNPKAANDQDNEQDDFGPLPTPRAELPAPGPWAGRLVQAVVEVIGGDRPLGQLVRWTDEHVYGQLRALVTSRRDGRTPRTRASVRSVHVSEPLDGVVEVCAVIHDGARARAYALRLEGADGRWCCTNLMLG
jgi:Family of unknown function (DUF6459)